MARAVGVALIAGMAVTALAGPVPAGITFQTQQREITAATTGDGTVQTLAATDFGPFVQSVTAATTVLTPAGPAPNAAVTRIDCQLNPNAVRAAGSLAGAGTALTIAGTEAVGDAKTVIIVTFMVATPTPFSLAVAPRPALRATDQFEMDLREVSGGTRVVSLSQDDPPQRVAMSGTLQPGEYRLRYRVECTFDAAEDSRDFSMNLALDCGADFNRADAVNVQDIFDFLTAWFAADPRADFNRSGALDVQDIFDFLGAWLNGCG